MEIGSAQSQAVAVLLGAGASMDAGLPSTFELTRRLIESLPPDLQQIYYFVIGVMRAEMGRAGTNPDQEVSAERVAAMIEMLAARHSLAIAPFVQQWDPSVETFNSSTRRQPWPSSDFRRAVEDTLKPLWDRLDEQQRVLESMSGGRGAVRMRPQSRPRRDSSDRLWRVVQKMIDEERAGGQDRFAMAASATRLALPSVLSVNDQTDLSYFDALFEMHADGRIRTVVTLNYDLTVETAASRRGVAIARGIEAWSERAALRFPNEQLRLLKLHGSIDWVRRVSDKQDENPKDAKTSAEGPSPVSGRRRLRYPREWIEVRSEPEPQSEPHLIFGEGSKLQIEGPFLDLLTQFRVELDDVDTLVVVGYSFGDAHVNAYIRKWLAASPMRRLHVVDPGVLDESSVRPLNQRRVLPGLVGTGFEVDLRDLLLRDSDGADAQVTFHRMTAREGLPQVLAQLT